ncbi:S-adenosyl-L-methionine-dependent methyltransferase [Ramaria rubella]|nr:S-adenosyl-L-methionine-dependent methyltransferase [Ramaria rubella]
MTKNKKSKSWKSKGKTNKPQETKEKKATDAHGNPWVQELKNEKFEAYYLKQNIIPLEEWPKFMKTLKEPLPTTFRLAGSRETVHELNDIIRSTYVPQLSDVIFEGVKVPPPIQIPWYPEGLAWHLNVAKSVLRRSPEFKKFHNFLVYETDVGNISRQEAVSMVPPLFLAVEPQHSVLDMCAAPGSKTAQLLEAMHSHSPAGTDASHIPSGLLIANDSDFKRTHLLVHQSSRLPSPALMVTNLDASNYPNITLAPPASSTRPLPVETLKFDRILCDVPCSGDGTLRKNIGIWGHWQPLDANGLHGLQLRILQRAMKLLKPAGKIVYSTCSLNPVENEAVVAAALRSAPDYELVDVSSQLSNLIRNPGLETWIPVVDKELTTFPSFDTFLKDWKTKNNGPRVQQNQIKMAETHWPPPDVAELNLTRCMRIYPHLQDMGGFFVAVLRRKNSETLGAAEQTTSRGCSKRAASVEPEASAPNAKRIKEFNVMERNKDEEELNIPDPPPTQTDNVSQTTGKNTVKGGESTVKLGKAKDKDSEAKFKEPPYTFLKPDHPQLLQTVERLSLLPTFPTSNIFVRNPEGGASTVPLRSMYLCNDMVKRVIIANDYAKIRLVAAGTKAFTRQDAGAITADDDEQTSARQQFRILDDAVTVVLPFISPETVLPGRLNDLKLLLENYYPLIVSFDQPFQSLLGSKENGNHLVRFQAGEWEGAMLTHPLVLPLWKSNASLSLMTDKKSKSALSLRVFGQDVTIFGQQTRERQAASQLRREAAASAKETQEEEAEVEADSELEIDLDDAGKLNQEAPEGGE